ncbi:MAG: protoheme IX farnesyltransferase [Actinobacteria bacterium]|nr:protoheme IX farnesyltransferase [Actinomycetota bacterium]
MTARDTRLTRVRSVAADYFELTKPRVQTLLLWTTVMAMLVAGDPSIGLILLTCLGGSLSAGSAGAINHYLDRDIDAQMTRTARRPVPAGRVSPRAALTWGVLLGVASEVVLVIGVNTLAAVLALAGLLGYVFVYTVWLKRRTPQNIVIGGAAGAIPPLVGWAAVTGSLNLTAWLMFAIVFVWTPPHFWALALLIRDEYAKSDVPMLPVVRGVKSTTTQILAYSVLLVATTLIPVATGAFGAIYCIAALILGGVFVWMAFRLSRDSSRPVALRTYLYSLSYLAALFLVMVVDTTF